MEVSAVFAFHCVTCTCILMSVRGTSNTLSHFFYDYIPDVRDDVDFRTYYNFEIDLESITKSAKCEGDVQSTHISCGAFFSCIATPFYLSLNVTDSYFQDTFNADRLPYVDNILYNRVGTYLFLYLCTPYDISELIQYLQPLPVARHNMCFTVYPMCIIRSDSWCSSHLNNTSLIVLNSTLFDSRFVRSFYYKTELSFINETCSEEKVIAILPPATKVINVINTDCLIDFTYECNSLESGSNKEKLSNIYAMNLTGSEKTITHFLKLLIHGSLPQMKKLVSFDISHSFRYTDIRLTVEDEMLNTYLPVLKTFYARKVFSLPCSFHSKKYQYMSCIEIRISERNLHSNIICIKPEILELLDIAENNIEYIDTSFTDSLTHLKVLDISGNLLHSRNGGADINFSRMAELTKLFCSNNKLKILSADIFDALPYLTLIDLSFNKLTSITFHIQHLHQLQALNLYKNNIKLLESFSMSEQLTNLIIYQKTHFNTTIQLNLIENPLICSLACENKAAMAWILQHENEIRFWPMSCELNQTLKHINTFTLDAIRESCKGQLYVGIACLLSTITAAVIIMTLVAVCRHRLRLRSQRRRVNLIRNFKEDKRRDRFPVFLSFCSSDADFVMEHVFEELNRRLQALLETNRRCVAIGDADFRPGLVLSELFRCISRCDVVIVCVSNDFLTSPMCMHEARETHFQRKSIILMFLEEVDMKLLSKSILILYFMTSCRAKWIKVNERPMLQPEWDVMCRSVYSQMDEHAVDSDEEETIV